MSRQSAPPVEAEKAYTIDQVAELKSVSPGFVRKAIRSTGQPDAAGRVTVPLAAKKVGKGYRLSASAIEAWWSALDDG